MKIVIASDHGGFPLKAPLVQMLQAEGHEVSDLGPSSPDPVDYPDYAEAVGRAVQKGEADRGIIVCGSGVGACIAANKLRGIRAALCHDTYSARQSVQHDDANILCLGARVIGVELAFEVVRAFVGARFSGEARHRRRLDKVLALEQKG